MRRAPVDCLLLLGGNLGDRRRRLREALARIKALAGTRLTARSRVYETAPVGPSDKPYLNLVVAVRTTLSPMGLLVELKRLEALAGRRPAKRWTARNLDIDLLKYGALRLRTPWLEVPHPRILERAFVLAPLAELAPRWKPDGRRPVARRLSELNPGPGLVRIYSDDL